MTDVRDPFVAAALRRLDPPPPGPGFWEDLVARLDGEMPAPVVPLVPGGGRPKSRRGLRVLSVMAAAAAVVAAVMVAGRSPRGGIVQTTEPTSPTSVAPVTTGPRPPAASPAEDAARAWIAAASRGETEAAWAILGPQSRESIGGKDALAALMASALREGWGAWAFAPDLTVGSAPLGEGDGEQLVVVTLSGTVAQEGPPRPAAVALPVRVRPDAALVEPFVPGPAVSLVTLPATGADPPVAPARGPIDIGIPGDAAASVVVVDGQVQPPETLDRSEDGAVEAWHPPRPLEPGEHTITVAYVTPSGTIAVHAAVFRTA